MIARNDEETWVRCDTLVTPLTSLANAAIRIRSGKTVEIRDAADAGSSNVVYEPGATVAPGFIDVHVHGAAGHDLMDGTLESLQAVSSTLVRYGTTSFLATTLSAPDADTETALRGFAAHYSEVRDGARPIGIHMEGPYLNPVRRGTHDTRYLKQADPAALRRFAEAASGQIRKLTVAPEMDPGGRLVREAVALGIEVSMGHSDATESQARAAADAGARHATHTFNAMRPLHQREPGILGFVLTDDRIFAEVIVDGVHVHPAAVRLLFRTKGAARTVLITDGLSAVGMPDGRYPLGDKEIIVANGECRDSDGTLAGSTLTLDRAVRNLAAWCEAPARDAIAAATLSPAQSMGMHEKRGAIAPGVDADLVFLDGQLRVLRTMVAGRTVYRRRAEP